MVANDRLVDELEKIREKLYRDQPDTFSTIECIINLLQYTLCEHVWEHGKDPNTPDGPGDRWCRCKKCGADQLSE